ncbi:MAG: hypothetical protein LUE64_07390 [Candidatus Gastranaerophilales bacterium]|nr:hypothetical protein [Candidatus Gastranaerophilales bacterium]
MEVNNTNNQIQQPVITGLQAGTPAAQPAPLYQPVQPVIYNIPQNQVYPSYAETLPAQPVIYNVPQGQVYPVQMESSKNEQPQTGENIQGIAGFSSLLSTYVKAAKGVTPVENNTTKNADWQNNLRENLRTGNVNMLAVIPRTMNAKDTDNNALIQEGEIRGNFINAIDRLDEIKAMGINTLHVLPINPPGKQNAMGVAGSLYAPADFLKVDPKLKDPNTEGTAEDQCKLFIQECHKRGISVMVDLPSCASTDFADKHPELMAYEKNGTDKTPGGWQDIRMFRVWDDEEKRVLNPHLLELHKQFVDFAQELGFDGIRADVGRAKPAEFWDVIIPYSREKDPDFGWLAETYTYEDASPQMNMPHDRPIELMKAGFDTYYGQYHIFDQWTKASQLHDYVNEQIDMQKEFSDKEPRTLIGSFSTHDDQSPMFYGGSPWVQFTSILQSMLPLCNPYFVDGVQSGDYYLYPYEHAYAPDTDTDTNECTVHKGRIDIFNPSRKPGGNNPEIGTQISNMLNLRNGEYKDVITKGSTCWIKPEPDNDQIICFARQYGGKTLLVVGNRNVNERNSAKINLKDMTHGQQLKDLTLPYGEKSYFQTEDGSLNLDLGPSRMHVFEINAPNIESDSYDVSKFENGVYTKVK